MRACCAVLCIALLCTGCWDMKEINQLAIVNLGGTDKDPKTGTITAYYQVINPSGLSSRQGGASRAAVYTFNFKEYSIGRFSVSTNTLMPRILFMPHMQSLIVTERYARQGVLDLINYYESSPDRRTNVILLVTSSPLSTIMNSYTPLDRIPGRYIRSLTDLSGRGYYSGLEPIRIKDMAKGMYQQQPTIIPLIEYTSDEPAENTDKLEEADVNKHAIRFVGGAVFIHARMVGRIDISRKQTFYILSNQLKTYVETLKINGSYVDVEAREIEVKRQFKASTGLSISVHANLRMINNQQKNSLNAHNIKAIEQAFNEVLEKKSNALVQLAKESNWDLLGLQDQNVQAHEWRETQVNFQIHSKIITVGNTIGPYFYEKD